MKYVMLVSNFGGSKNKWHEFYPKEVKSLVKLLEVYQGTGTVYGSKTWGITNKINNWLYDSKFDAWKSFR